MNGITDKSYLQGHNNVYEHKRKLHLNHGNHNSTYKLFDEKTGRYAGRTSKLKAYFSRFSSILELCY